MALVATGWSARALRVRAVVLEDAALAATAVRCRLALGGKNDGSLSRTTLTLEPWFLEFRVVCVVTPSPSPATRLRDLVVTMALRFLSIVDPIGD